MAQVGEVVAVIHTQVFDRGGHAILINTKPHLESIKQVYADGRVVTQSGDVWQVRPTTKFSGARYATVR